MHSILLLFNKEGVRRRPNLLTLFNITRYFYFGEIFNYNLLEASQLVLIFAFYVIHPIVMVKCCAKHMHEYIQDDTQRMTWLAYRCVI